MVRGIGVDIVKLERIEAAYERFGERFARKVLSADELATSAITASFIAKRFASKEAIELEMDDRGPLGSWARGERCGALEPGTTDLHDSSFADALHTALQASGHSKLPLIQAGGVGDADGVTGLGVGGCVGWGGAPPGPARSQRDSASPSRAAPGASGPVIAARPSSRAARSFATSMK